MKFLFIQLLGIFAWFLDIASYWFENKKHLLITQVLADFFFVYHYYLLGAKVGSVICFISAIRELCFYLINSKKREKLLCWIAICVYVMIGFFTVSSVVDWLPVFAEIIYCYTLMSCSEDIVFGGIIDSIYWIIYGIVCHSYAGVITDMLVIISNSIVLIKRKEKGFNIKKTIQIE